MSAEEDPFALLAPLVAEINLLRFTLRETKVSSYPDLSEWAEVTYAKLVSSSIRITATS